MRRTPHADRAFTLVELMIVVAIIGILASVAIPSFSRYTLRAKAAERTLILGAISRGIEDYHMRYDAFPQAFGGWSMVNLSNNPPWPPTVAKRPLEVRAWDDWQKISVQIMGNLYGSYWAFGWQMGNMGNYTTGVDSDIDGDGDFYWSQRQYQFASGGWTNTFNWPVPGSWDDKKF